MFVISNSVCTNVCLFSSECRGRRAYGHLTNLEGNLFIFPPITGKQSPMDTLCNGLIYYLLKDCLLYFRNAPKTEFMGTRWYIPSLLLSIRLCSLWNNSTGIRPE